jgi:hypothetical protein
MDLLPWPSYWLPHPWCENTVSHHGVNVAASFNFLLFKMGFLHIGFFFLIKKIILVFFK